MKKVFQYSLFILLSVLFISCTKYSFKSVDKKIVGQWDFDKVTIRKNWALSSTDITNQYQDNILQFNDNGDFYSIDTYNKDTLIGNWDIEVLEYMNSSDVMETDYFLHLYTYNNATSDIEHYIWEITSVGAKKMRAEEKTSDNVYRYVLNRR